MSKIATTKDNSDLIGENPDIDNTQVSLKLSQANVSNSTHLQECSQTTVNGSARDIFADTPKSISNIDPTMNSAPLKQTFIDLMDYLTQVIGDDRSASIDQKINIVNTAVQRAEKTLAEI